MTRGRWFKIFGRIILSAIAAIVGIVLLALVAFNVSPWPSALIFRRAFESGNVQKPRGYAAAQKAVAIESSLTYPSQYQRNDFDLYLPKSSKDATASAEVSLPIIVWVHGGGFISGDKLGVSTYATMLAAQGYAVAAMNYDYAPDAQYPAPVVQVGELIVQLYRIAARYGLDANRIIIGGDSAGAQIAAQFAAIETTPGYAAQAGIRKIALHRPLEAALLFCGPYDVSQMTDMGSSWIAKQFVQTVGWSYLGQKHWQYTKAAKTASVVDFVSANFPRSYIVDGNYFSFPSQAREMYGRLRAQKVAAKLTLYPDNPKLPHEFQFDFSHPQSYEVWNNTLQFLKS
ncbi:alpha/beta hydrolase [Bifidobacterium aquikefiricola]|uniref:Alpha/beta hydrolase n=1 Tax=Bifidobacterium aquikefiricola TaxID=3059038 RepID=A0AB39U829_9BIFI